MVKLGAPPPPDRFVVDILTEAVCFCRDDKDDSVQLQVIKALLTAISSPMMSVREQSLLLAVRAVYHIYLTSRNAVNKNTAKGTLRQIMNIVFQRMEAWAQRQDATFSKGTGAGATVIAPASATAAAAAASAQAAAAVAASAQAAVAVAASALAVASAPPAPIMAEVMLVSRRAAAPAAAPAAPAPAPAPAPTPNPFGPNMYDSVAQSLGLWSPEAAPAPEAATSSAAEEAPSAEETCTLTLPLGPDGAPLLPAALAGQGWSVLEGSLKVVGAAVAAAAAAGSGAPASAGSAPASAPGSAPAAPGSPAVGKGGPGAFVPGSTSPDSLDLGDFPSQSHRDAFLLFRALCRLSMRGDEDPLLPRGAVNLQATGESSGRPPPAPALSSSGIVLHSDESLLADPIFLQSKLLALDLVLALLEGAGPAFQVREVAEGLVVMWASVHV